MSEADEQVQQSLSGTGVWDHFTMRDGLPDMKIECVFEDSQGVLWIGTHDRGVVRYDGDEFRSYTSRDGLTADGVFSVLEDSDGVLWFGTNRGLIRFDEVNFEHIAADEPYGLLWGSVLDKRGYLWFGLESRPEKPPAACYWDGEKLNLIELDVEATSQGKSIHRVLVDDTGKVWLAGSGSSAKRGEVSDSKRSPVSLMTPFWISFSVAIVPF
jgi:hypothetical protein